MTLIDKAEVRWPVRGYAPGAYSCKCRKCGQAFIGDKRAYQCQDCVIQDLAALPARWVVAKLVEAWDLARSHSRVKVTLGDGDARKSWGAFLIAMDEARAAITEAGQ